MPLGDVKITNVKTTVVESSTDATLTIDWVLENFISYKRNISDIMELKSQDSLEDISNYINGINTEGTSVMDIITKSVIQIDCF